LPAVGLFVLALALLSTAAWRLRARKALHSALAILVVPMLAGVLSSPAHAQVSVPNTFTNGDIADADQINANFTALQGAFNGLDCATAAEVSGLNCATSAEVSGLDCATSAEVVCAPALTCPDCGSSDFYDQGVVAGAASVDITTDNAVAAAAAGNAACTQAGGTWDGSTCTAASSYNCFVGGFCSQAAISFPPATYGYTNVYDGHTQGTEPALGAGCNNQTGLPSGFDRWVLGYELDYFTFMQHNLLSICAP
jgi:hypothetical protein